MDRQKIINGIRAIAKTLQAADDTVEPDEIRGAGSLLAMAAGALESTPPEPMTGRDFLETVRKLLNVDADQYVAAVGDAAGWEMFRDSPTKFLLAHPGHADALVKAAHA